MLLIDDIQFIAGKVATQEEFFHTFDKLYEDGKQIVLTSDRPPKDINHLEDRLRTRFESGLIADIQPPDLDLRMAIIKKKAEQVNLSISEEILTYLAENLRSNIRQLEGAIKKLGAQQFLNGIQSKITLDMAKSCVDQLLGEAEPLSVTIDKIFSAVFRVYGVDKADLVGKNRSRKIALPRHVSIYLIRSITEMSFPNIGKIFDKDHSTIVNSISKVQSLMFSDSEFNKLITDLEKEIRSSVRI
jgi:chromosomal replication initiator protein